MEAVNGRANRGAKELDDLQCRRLGSRFVKTPGGLEPPCRALQARACPARPRCQSPREESNLCARGRNPLLFQLSYGGKSGALGAPSSSATRGADGGGRTL